MGVLCSHLGLMWKRKWPDLERLGSEAPEPEKGE